MQLNFLFLQTCVIKGKKEDRGEIGKEGKKTVLEKDKEKKKK